MRIENNHLLLSESDATELDCALEVPIEDVIMLAMRTRERALQMPERANIHSQSGTVHGLAEADQINCRAKYFHRLARAMISQPGVAEAATEEVVQQFEALFAD